MNVQPDGNRLIVRTERGLSIAGTHIKISPRFPTFPLTQGLNNKMVFERSHHD